MTLCHITPRWCFARLCRYTTRPRCERCFALAIDTDARWRALIYDAPMRYLCLARDAMARCYLLFRARLFAIRHMMIKRRAAQYMPLRCRCARVPQKSVCLLLCQYARDICYVRVFRIFMLFDARAAIYMFRSDAHARLLRAVFMSARGTLRRSLRHEEAHAYAKCQHLFVDVYVYIHVVAIYMRWDAQPSAQPDAAARRQICLFYTLSRRYARQRCHAYAWCDEPWYAARHDAQMIFCLPFPPSFLSLLSFSSSFFLCREYHVCEESRRACEAHWGAARPPREMRQDECALLWEAYAPRAAIRVQLQRDAGDARASRVCRYFRYVYVRCLTDVVLFRLLISFAICHASLLFCLAIARRFFFRLPILPRLCRASAAALHHERHIRYISRHASAIWWERCWLCSSFAYYALLPFSYQPLRYATFEMRCCRYATRAIRDAPRGALEPRVDATWRMQECACTQPMFCCYAAICAIFPDSADDMSCYYLIATAPMPMARIFMRCAYRLILLRYGAPLTRFFSCSSCADMRSLMLCPLCLFSYHALLLFISPADGVAAIIFCRDIARRAMLICFRLLRLLLLRFLPALFSTPYIDIAALRVCYAFFRCCWCRFFVFATLLRWCRHACWCHYFAFVTAIFRHACLFAVWYFMFRLLMRYFRPCLLLRMLFR